METIVDFLKLQRPRVRSNVEIVTPETIGQDFFLHIDIKPPKTFFPMVSKRGLSKEDNNVPRITVCDNLVSCIRGYGALYPDFTNRVSNTYKLSKLDFEYAFKPNNKLVPDADYTDEYWLVTYNKNTVSYKPEIVGEFFVKEITLTGKPVDGVLYNDAEGLLYIEITDDINVRLDKNKIVNKGYYSAKFNYVKDEIVSYTEITKQEYKVNRNNYAHIATESLRPLYTNW